MGTILFNKIKNRVYPLSHLVFYIQRAFMRPVFRDMLAKLASKRLPPITVVTDKDDIHILDELNANGYAMMPDMAKPAEIAEAVEWLENKPVFDTWNPKCGTFSPDSPPKDCHIAHFLSKDIINCPHALKWANDPKVLAIVGKWLGCKPTLSGLNIWWSYPGRTTAQEAQNFHRDVDDLKFVKLFLYLTDVDEESGPHVFVPGSHNYDGFRKIRRYSDDEVAAKFGKSGIKYFSGEKGTSFFENTFGLHKGQLPKGKRRLLFQAQYSLHPIGIYDYSPVTLKCDDGLHKDPYVNRLYLKQ